jgi:bacterioferritin (cytochrome b1)
MQTTALAENAVARLNSLLRAELAAIETYEQALRKLNGPGTEMADQLVHFAAEHSRNADALKARVEALEGTCSTSSGVWGAWSKIVQGSATVFGDGTAIKALEEGEKRGLKDYQEALEDDHLDEVSRRLVENDLIPRQRKHIAALDAFLIQIRSLPARAR